MFELFRQDVQRWIAPEQIAPASEVTAPRTLKLLLRHKPLRALVWFRLGAWASRRRVRGLPSLMMWLLNTFYGLDISIGPEYGGGLYLPHPIGTVLTPQRVGRNCTIIASVTVGMRGEHAFPVIGDNVYIGAGARVLGGITVGDGAQIGANAVVIHDVPAGATVVGIPAHVIGRRQPTPDQPLGGPAA